MMCGGDLAIMPNEGGGTVVTMTIPDKAAKYRTTDKSFFDANA